MERARFPVRWSAELGFALTWGASLLVLIGGGAPTSWLAVQAGAGLLALTLFLPAIRHRMAQWAAYIIFVAPIALLGTAFLDPGIDGVHRWLSVGPLRLHMGLLLLPAFIVVYATGKLKQGLAMVFLTASFLALQPDLGMVIGLVGALAFIAASRRTRNDSLLLFWAVFFLLYCLFKPDPLEPVALVEGVLTDSWGWQIWTGPLALLGALILPIALVIGKWTVNAQNLPSYALAGMWCGLLLASLIGPYPVPLLGYGASAVIGFGLAISLLTKAHERRMVDAA